MGPPTLLQECTLLIEGTGRARIPSLPVRAIPTCRADDQDRQLRVTPSACWPGISTESRKARCGSLLMGALLWFHVKRYPML